MAYEKQRTVPDMWVEPEDGPRETGSQPRGERAVLLDYLQHYRLTFGMKLDELDAEQLARRSVEPSSMSLLGLLRHMAGVEHSWFHHVMDGDWSETRPFRPDRERDYEFDDVVADEQLVAEARRAWRDEIAFAEAYVARTEDLATLGTMADGTTLELREVLVHMIEEYARHCGHADLLRERIDGRTGQ